MKSSVKPVYSVFNPVPVTGSASIRILATVYDPGHAHSVHRNLTSTINKNEERIYTLSSAQIFFKLKCPYISVDLCYCLTPRPVVIIGKVSGIMKEFLNTVDGCSILEFGETENLVPDLMKVQGKHSVIDVDRIQINHLRKHAIMPIVIHVRCTNKLENRLRRLKSTGLDSDSKIVDSNLSDSKINDSKSGEPNNFNSKLTKGLGPKAFSCLWQPNLQ